MPKNVKQSSKKLFNYNYFNIYFNFLFFLFLTYAQFKNNDCFAIALC